MKQVIVCIIIVLAFPSLSCAAKKPQARPQAAKAHKGVTRIGYAIQVGAFKEVSNAERLEAKLDKSGIDAFYFKKEDGLFAVRFGDFTSRDEAKAHAEKLVKKGLIETYFIAAPVEVVTVKGGLAGTRPGDQRRRDDDMGAITARTAERFVGIPYKWGGNTVVDGMDCSGFTKAVYNLCGVNIPRTAREQFSTGDPVSREHLKDGDLIFFGDKKKITHVGVYVGNGMMVHAPKRGEDIARTSITSGYFYQHYAGARRYF